MNIAFYNLEVLLIQSADKQIQMLKDEMKNYRNKHRFIEAIKSHRDIKKASLLKLQEHGFIEIRPFMENQNGK